MLFYRSIMAVHAPEGSEFGTVESAALDEDTALTAGAAGDGASLARSHM